MRAYADSTHAHGQGHTDDKCIECNSIHLCQISTTPCNLFNGVCVFKTTINMILGRSFQISANYSLINRMINIFGKFPVKLDCRKMKRRHLFLFIEIHVENFGNKDCLFIIVPNSWRIIVRCTFASFVIRLSCYWALLHYSSEQTQYVQFMHILHLTGQCSLATQTVFALIASKNS